MAAPFARAATVEKISGKRRHALPPPPSHRGVEETSGPHEPTHQGRDGAARLLSALADRSGPPHRTVGELINRWYAASCSSLRFDEWADPAAGDLARAFEGASDVRDVEEAVVAFAQARAGAGHPVDAVTVDLVALVRLAWPSGRGTWGEAVDPIGLTARAIGAWAEEHAASTSCADCVDAVTGLASPGYVRERVRELHDQCRALAISPAVTFGAVVVQLAFGALLSTERMRARVVAARLLTERFRGGETVAALGPSRLAVVMPAYGIDRAVEEVTADLAGLAASGGVDVAIRRQAFAADAASTFGRLAGTPPGS